MEKGNWVDVFRKHFPSGNYTLGGHIELRDWKNQIEEEDLDHIWVSPDLAKKSKKCKIYSNIRGWDRPSDHVPILSVF